VPPRPPLLLLRLRRRLLRLLRLLLLLLRRRRRRRRPRVTRRMTPLQPAMHCRCHDMGQQLRTIAARHG
jgi:hypothetical protein